MFRRVLNVLNSLPVKSPAWVLPVALQRPHRIRDWENPTLAGLRAAIHSQVLAVRLKPVPSAGRAVHLGMSGGVGFGSTSAGQA
jgi:hypothetical protein